MEISMSNQNQQLFSNQEKMNKSCQMDLHLKANFESEARPRKNSQHRDVIISMLQRIMQLQSRIEILQNSSFSSNRKKKKIRRKAKEIQREFKCSYSTCEKFYGSKTSLKNHMKIKHGYRMRRYIIQNRQNRSED